jgi:hypothetical protein
MKIVRYVVGWRIEPSTNNEESFLEFLLNALQDKYSNSVILIDEFATTDKVVLTHDHTNLVSGR